MDILEILDEHGHYLADLQRLSAFESALSRVVQPDSVVLDLGSGTGILGLLACRAGARKVYSVEAGPVIELARKLCAVNGFQDRVVFVRGLSTAVDLPEPVDLVVADQIGFGSEFGLFGYFDDARVRLLKPGGTMMPARVDMWLAPVECSDIYDRIDFWARKPVGFDFTPFRQIATNTYFRYKLSCEQLLSAPNIGASVNLLAASPDTLHFNESFIAARPGTLHGIGGWFSAQLAADVTISNSPLESNTIDRAHVFFPIERPIEVSEGDRIDVTMHILTANHVVTWSAEVTSMRGEQNGQLSQAHSAKASQSTWRAMLISPEKLHKTRPDFVPTLKPRVAAWQSVLELCDGQRTVAEIERELYKRHGDLFQSHAEAATYVAEIISSDTV